MICYPRVWTTIFATEKDRRSFVEMSLERSQSLPLEVTVKTCRRERDPTECSCEEGESGELLPNEKTPCEWHFVFEPLAYPKNSKRIQVLNMDFPNASLPRVFTLGNFCLLDSPLPQVTTVVWKGEWTNYTPQPFPGPRSFPNLRSLTFGARWTHSLNKVNNITSFAIRTGWSIDAEEFRLFVLNNLSLETLELRVKIRGSTKGPPADLLNVKSLSLDPCPKVLSNVIHVPAFQRLSSLRISLECEIGDLYTLRATGGGISLSVNSWVLDVAEDWQHLIGYARPTIRYVSIYDQQPVDTYPYGSFSTPLTALMADAHTVDIGLSYSEYWGGEFWIELQELGPQLKTIRFEVSEKMGPFGGSSDPDYCGGHILDKIADLVEHRFKGGRPFSTVERMIVSGDKRVDRLHDHVWGSFCDGRRIREYLASA